LDEVKDVRKLDLDVFLRLKKALTQKAQLFVLKGNLAHSGRSIEPSAASRIILQHRGARGGCIEDIDDYKADQ